MNSLFSYRSIVRRAIVVAVVGLAAATGAGCGNNAIDPGGPVQGSGGTGGSAATGGTTGHSDAAVSYAIGDGSVCPNYFSVQPDGAPSLTRCCPDPAPDCSDEPDGFPGYACTPPTNPYCSCSCQGHVWWCGC
jgi:hypothetical protein